MWYFLLGTLTDQLQKELNAEYDNVAVKELFVESSPKQQLECVYFSVKDIPHNLLNHVYIMGNKYRNDLFDICWKKQCNLYTNLAFEEIYAIVFKPVLDECKEILFGLQQRTMTLENVDKYFQNFDSDTDMEDNLKKLCQGYRECFPNTYISDAKQWVHGVVKQIKECQRIYVYTNVAMILLDLKESLKLRGDFTVIEKFAEQVTSSSVIYIIMFNVTIYLYQRNARIKLRDVHK